MPELHLIRCDLGNCKSETTTDKTLGWFRITTADDQTGERAKFVCPDQHDHMAVDLVLVQTGVDPERQTRRAINRERRNAGLPPLAPTGPGPGYQHPRPEGSPGGMAQPQTPPQPPAVEGVRGPLPGDPGPYVDPSAPGGATSVQR